MTLDKTRTSLGRDLKGTFKGDLECDLKGDKNELSVTAKRQ